MTSSTEYGGRGATLVPGTLRGFRQWQAGHAGYLDSLSVTYTWEQAQIEAECCKSQWRGTQYSLNGHTAPQADCTCGIYAKHAPDGMQFSGFFNGVIEAWGRVEVGTEGFRAQKARIVALAMPRSIVDWQYAEWMRETGRRYQGVRFFPSSVAMWEEYPPIDVSELVPPTQKPTMRDDPFNQGGMVGFPSGYVYSWSAAPVIPSTTTNTSPGSGSGASTTSFTADEVRRWFKLGPDVPLGYTGCNCGCNDSEGGP